MMWSPEDQLEDGIVEARSREWSKFDHTKATLYLTINSRDRTFNWLKERRTIST